MGSNRVWPGGSAEQSGPIAVPGAVTVPAGGASATTSVPAVSRGWITRFGVLFFGQNISWAAPTQIMLAVQVLAFYPHDKERMLAWLMAAGGLGSVVAGPIVGRLSDLTRSRFGRRLPWIAGGTLASAMLLVVAGFADDYVLLLIAWVGFQITLSCSQTSVQSIPPDRVPDRQYGVISGVMGMTYTAAVVAGSALGAALSVRAAYVIDAAIMLACVVPFLASYREPERTVTTQPAGYHLPSFRTASDFWWVFLARLLVTMAQAIALFYLLYFLRDRVHYADPSTGVLILSAIYAVFVIASAFWPVSLLRQATLAPPFDFTKGVPVLAVPGTTYSDPYAFGTMLFDLAADPLQAHPVIDDAVELRMATQMRDLMIAHDAPASQFA